MKLRRAHGRRRLTIAPVNLFNEALHENLDAARGPFGAEFEKELHQDFPPSAGWRRFFRDLQSLRGRSPFAACLAGVADDADFFTLRQSAVRIARVDPVAEGGLGADAESPLMRWMVAARPRSDACALEAPLCRKYRCRIMQRADDFVRHATR